MPVFGLVFDPDDGHLRWADLTGHLRANPNQDAGVVLVAREAVLTAESLRGSFLRAVEGYTHDGVGAVASGLLSDTDTIQVDAVFDAWALGRHDVRYLVLLRRLLVELRGASVRRAIVALSHATPHPDIFWTRDNWIPDVTKRRAAESFRWSPRELAHMLSVIGEDDWGRGQLAQSLDMLVREDPESAAVLDWSVGLLLGRGDFYAATSAALLLLASSENPRATLAGLKRKHPDLLQNSWFTEIADTVETWGAISLY